jgi:hypothetical protein
MTAGSVSPKASLSRALAPVCTVINVPVSRAPAKSSHGRFILPPCIACAVTDDGLVVVRGSEATSWSFENGLRRIAAEHVQRTATVPARRLHLAQAMRHAEPMRQHQGMHLTQSMWIESKEGASHEQPGARVEYYTSGNTVLVRSADGRAPQHFYSGDAR